MLHRHAGPAVAGSYLAGAISGALVSASALFIVSGLLSPVPAAWRGGVAITGLALLGLHVLRIVCLDFLPQRKYQIPRETFTASPPQASFLFAFELGTGVRTYITSVAPYALAITMLCCLPEGLGPAALAAGLAGVGYGVGRSVVVASQSVRSTIAVEHPRWALRAADLGAVALAAVIAVRFTIAA